MVKQRITTTIDPKIKKMALLNDVIWSEALEIGIKILLGHNNQSERIKESIERHKNTITVLEQQLEDCIKKQQEIQAHEDSNVYMEIPKEIIMKQNANQNN